MTEVRENEGLSQGNPDTKIKANPDTERMEKPGMYVSFLAIVISAIIATATGVGGLVYAFATGSYDDAVDGLRDAVAIEVAHIKEKTNSLDVRQGNYEMSLKEIRNTFGERDNEQDQQIEHTATLVERLVSDVAEIKADVKTLLRNGY